MTDYILQHQKINVAYMNTLRALLLAEIVENLERLLAGESLALIPEERPGVELVHDLIVLSLEDIEAQIAEI